MRVLHEEVGFFWQWKPVWVVDVIVLWVEYFFEGLIDLFEYTSVRVVPVVKGRVDDVGGIVGEGEWVVEVVGDDNCGENAKVLFGGGLEGGVEVLELSAVEFDELEHFHTTLQPATKEYLRIFATIVIPNNLHHPLAFTYYATYIVYAAFDHGHHPDARIFKQINKAFKEILDPQHDYINDPNWFPLPKKANLFMQNTHLLGCTKGGKAWCALPWCGKPLDGRNTQALLNTYDMAVRPDPNTHHRHINPLSDAQCTANLRHGQPTPLTKDYFIQGLYHQQAFGRNATELGGDLPAIPPLPRHATPIVVPPIALIDIEQDVLQSDLAPPTTRPTVHTQPSDPNAVSSNPDQTQRLCV
jgi:hypothetical protein